MKYAISTYTFDEPGSSIAGLVREFAGMGFDTMSFMPRDVAGLEPGEAKALAAVMNERDLTATIHANCDNTREEFDELRGLFGGRLYSITFDGARTQDSRGALFDAPKIARTLADVEACTRGTDVRFGVEDLPLDDLALDFYRADLAPFVDNPRFGMLVDIGHMNLKFHHDAYFQRLTVEEYFTRVPVPILEVHVHDNAGDGDRHAYIGFGDIDFEAVAGGLHAAGFDGISTIEICPIFHGSTPAEAKPRAKESLENWRALWERPAANG